MSDDTHDESLLTGLARPEKGSATMNSHQKDLLRHEGFVHGFVAARDPKNPRDTLLVLEEAERAWTIHVAQREAAAR